MASVSTSWTPCISRGGSRPVSITGVRPENIDGLPRPLGETLKPLALYHKNRLPIKHGKPVRGKNIAGVTDYLRLSFLRNIDGDGVRRSHAPIVSDSQGHPIGAGFGKFMRRICLCAKSSIHKIPGVTGNRSIGISGSR